MTEPAAKEEKRSPAVAKKGNGQLYVNLRLIQFSDCIIIFLFTEKAVKEKSKTAVAAKKGEPWRRHKKTERTTNVS